MKKYVKGTLDKLGSKISKLLDSMWNINMEDSSAAASLAFKRAKEVTKRYECDGYGVDVIFAKFVEGLMEQNSLKDCLNYCHKYCEENGHVGVDSEFIGLWLNFKFPEVRKMVSDYAIYLSEEKPYLNDVDGIVESLTSFIYTLIAEEDFFCGDVKSALFDRFVDDLMGPENYDDINAIEEEGFGIEGYTEEQRECVEILLCSDAMVDIFKGVPKYHKVLVDCWKDVFKHSSLNYYNLC